MIIQLLQQHHHRLQKVWLFGSRARGDFQSVSDIDLAVEVNEEPAFLDLKDDLNQLPLIYSFDLIDYKKITNPILKEQIIKEGIIIFETGPSGKVLYTMSKLHYKFTDLKLTFCI